jgi:hypothetical protein
LGKWDKKFLAGGQVGYNSIDQIPSYKYNKINGAGGRAHMRCTEGEGREGKWTDRKWKRRGFIQWEYTV